VGPAMNSILQPEPWPSWAIILLTIGLIIVVIGLLILIIPPKYRKGILARINPKVYWRKYQESKYWKHFGVSYEIISAGKLEIDIDNLPDNKYRFGDTYIYTLTLPIKVKFSSNNPDENVRINCSMLQLKIKPWETDTKMASCNLFIPAGHNMDKDQETLFYLSPQSRIETKDYVFKSSSRVRPNIGNKTYISTDNKGVINIIGHDDRGINFKLFEVDVDWAKVKDKVNEGDIMNNYTPLTKKRFERLLKKAAQPLPQKECAPEGTQTSASHQHDDYSDKCKSQDKTEGKEG